MTFFLNFEDNDKKYIYNSPVNKSINIVFLFISDFKANQYFLSKNNLNSHKNVFYVCRGI